MRSWRNVCPTKQAVNSKDLFEWVCVCVRERESLWVKERYITGITHFCPVDGGVDVLGGQTVRFRVCVCERERESLCVIERETEITGITHLFPVYTIQ